ncbi:uncharacterized protein [Battus philenor]|uniref:uncharacterized protein n=1 Tax=Battus philenor TaxID=42288 RepID=UPI0035CED6D7
MSHFYRHHQCRVLFLITVLIGILSISYQTVISNVPEDLLSELYSKYKEAVEDDSVDSTRRVFSQNRYYNIHIKKLKEVNGLKYHNLMIKEESRNEKNPLIYIDNPVESKVPNAYLTLEEFKEILTNRVLKQRQALSTRLELILRTPKVRGAPTKLVLKKNLISTTSKQVTRYTKLTPKLFHLSTSKPIYLSTLNTKTSRNIITQTKISTSSNPSIISSIITSKIIRNISKASVVNTAESSKNYVEKATESTVTYKENLRTNNPETSASADVSVLELRTESITTHQSTTENVVEEIEEARTEISTTTVVTEATRKTRRTLGRPLVFMGSNK